MRSELWKKVNSLGDEPGWYQYFDSNAMEHLAYLHENGDVWDAMDNRWIDFAAFMDHIAQGRGFRLIRLKDALDLVTQQDAYNELMAQEHLE